MRIPCPHCGLRDHGEFTYGEDGSATRPEDGEGNGPDALEAWTSFVYRRDNPMGPHNELWQHSQGCGLWLMVRRDTRTNAIQTVRVIGPWASHYEVFQNVDHHETEEA